MLKLEHRMRKATSSRDPAIKGKDKQPFKPNKVITCHLLEGALDQLFRDLRQVKVPVTANREEG